MASAERADRQAQAAAWTGAIINVLLTVGKGAVGVMTGSRALVADAVHSAADVVGSIAVIIGLQIARKPPDADHPYGHGRAELISSGMVGGILIAAAIDVAYSSIRALFTVPNQPRVAAAVAAAVAVIVKEILFQHNYRLGKKLSSKSLIATAYDHRSDVLSSLAALAGILLSLLGRWLHAEWLQHMDAVAGALVAVLVLKMALKITGESVQILMDRAVEGEDVAAYTVFVGSIPGVQRVDGLRIRDHGRYVILDVKIGVDAQITVAAGHDVADAVKLRLIDEFPRVLDVLVHVNPYYSDSRDGKEPQGV